MRGILATMFIALITQCRRLFVIAIVLIFLAALGAAIVWQQYFRSPSPSTSSQPTQGSGGQAGQASPVATGTPEAPPALVVRDLPSASAAAPSYTGEPVHVLVADPEVLRQVPVETHERSKAELADLAVKLAEHPRRPDDWMRVAFIKRFYHDYTGARDAYEYLNIISEADALPFFNLGGLYGYYLQEPARALPKYEAAIQRDPINSSFYAGLSDFYRDVLKDMPAAERTLLKGLRHVPTDPNLLAALAALAEAMGDMPKAVSYYERALAVAVGEGERAAITAAIERLKAGR